MAGARLNLDTVADLVGVMQQLAFTPRDLESLHRDIGERLLRTTKERFRTQKDPTGAPFVPLSAATLRDRQKKGIRSTLILVARGTLSHSGLAYQATAASTEVGSNLIYAAIQQLGGRVVVKGHTITIPARPYLGVSRDDKEEINALIQDHIEDKLRGNLP